MTNQPGTLEGAIGNTFGLRTWIEYGFKQVKDELGWADYRVTEARTIERWWELVMSAYFLVSLQSPIFAALHQAVRLFVYHYNLRQRLCLAHPRFGQRLPLLF